MAESRIPANTGDLLVYALPIDLAVPMNGSGVGITYRIGRIVAVDDEGMVCEWADSLGQNHPGRPKSTWAASKVRIEEKLGHRVKDDDLDDAAMLAGEFDSLADTRDYILNFWRTP